MDYYQYFLKNAYFYPYISNYKNLLEDEKMKPIQKFQAGGIQAAIWSNEVEVNGEKFDIKSVTLQRTYKDKNGEWKTSNSLKSTDLPKAMVVLGKAYEFLMLKEEAIEAE